MDQRTAGQRRGARSRPRAGRACTRSRGPPTAVLASPNSGSDWVGVALCIGRVAVAGTIAAYEKTLYGYDFSHSHVLVAPSHRRQTAVDIYGGGIEWPRGGGPIRDLAGRPPRRSRGLDRHLQGPTANRHRGMEERKPAGRRPHDPPA